MKRMIPAGMACIALLTTAALGLTNGDGKVAGSGHGHGGGFEPLPAVMNDARAKHTATLLPDGRVLIAGGYRTSPHVSHDSAEIFDPVTRTFTVTGSMNDRRQCHTATNLSNGLVLVAGGNNETDESYRTAEIYDPATGTFTSTGSMTEVRTCAMATLLPDDTVLVAGGYDSAGVYSSTAEIYDPQTGTFGAPLQMNYARGCHAQILLHNGLVLLTTGCNTAEHAELFDWTDGSFTVVGELTCQRKYPFAMLLADGRVLIAGGLASGKDVDTMEIYTPSHPGGDGTLTLVERRLITGRWRGAEGLLPDGRVLIMGGITEYGNGKTKNLRSAQVYDPQTGKLGRHYQMSDARGNWPRFVMTGYGYGVVFGGIDADGEATNTCDAWSMLGRW